MQAMRCVSGTSLRQPRSDHNPSCQNSVWVIELRSVTAGDLVKVSLEEMPKQEYCCKDARQHYHFESKPN